ncbi:winged helix-turn-helix domain-containing protein [Streptomyces sp. NBC_00481]|uniref:winged helix-turn-helix domain-containing protein n=1 Tax=unclassified Streptomyces TaxID=2593676 RepID=UPI003FA3449A
MFRGSLKAVDNWWAKWLTGGREALESQPRGRRVGKHQLLGEAGQQAVRQAVLDHRPCDLGLAGQLWTRAGVRDLIAKLYRARLTEQGVGNYLRRWGLSFQRPDKRAVEQEKNRSLDLYIAVSRCRPSRRDWRWCLESRQLW